MRKCLLLLLFAAPSYAGLSRPTDKPPNEGRKGRMDERATERTLERTDGQCGMQCAYGVSPECPSGCTCVAGQCQPGQSVLPVLPITTASDWPPVQQTDHYHFGDIRAVVDVPSGTHEQEVQVFWRRRDPAPAGKAVVVMDAAGNSVPVTSAVVEAGCGLITFSPNPAGGVHHVYYLSFFSYGCTYPGFHFSWFNGTRASGESDSRPEPLLKKSSNQSVCEVATASASFVRGLENRDEFHGFTYMEMAALPSEVEHVRQLEHRENQVRMFGEGQIPVAWAKEPTGERLLLEARAQIGEFFVFQIGLFSHTPAPVRNVRVIFSDLLPESAGAGPAVPADQFTCFNTEGSDYYGRPITKTVDLSVGEVASLWVGVQLPPNGVVKGAYQATIKLTCDACQSSKSLTLALDISSPGDQPVANSGDGDVQNLSRLRWLNSQRGNEQTVTRPFVPVGVNNSTITNTTTVTCLNKEIDLDPSGMPAQLTVISTKVRKDKPVSSRLPLLAAPVRFEVFKDGVVQAVTVTQSVKIQELSDPSVTWAAALEVGELAVDVKGTLEFDAYMSMGFNLKNQRSTPLSLSDVHLVAPLLPTPFMVGMGRSGQPYQDTQWQWNNGTSASLGPSSVLLGGADAGFFLKLKGPEDSWNIPFPSTNPIPASWGGADAGKAESTIAGCNITNHTVVCFCGELTLAPGQSLEFLFDVVATPAKPVDMAAHWKQRYLQVGYGQLSSYISPQEAKERNATIVTLHQGVKGIVNGTMVNPYINYPFLPKTVDLLRNFTEQANALGMQAKFYYTLRELSNHAAELFSILALKGEILIDGAGNQSIDFCTDWDCKGGAAYLQQHIAEHYQQCWQQPLSNGEVDAALCDSGLSRWFNYYVEGIHWSFGQPPFINGIYYDGIAFSRKSMARVRRVTDAAVPAGKPLPLLDVHTGREPYSPPAVAYLSHYAYMDSVWNGEGYSYSSGPGYWLMECSGLPHGLSGDRLSGTGPTNDFRSLLFGMTERNSATAESLWSFFDLVDIAGTTMVGWWEGDSPVTLSYTCPPSESPPNAQEASPGEVKATVFTKYRDRAVLVLASWCAQDVSVTAVLDWNALGLAQASTKVDVPPIQGLQKEGKIDLSTPFIISAQGGVVVVLSK
eukprot:CAMPEP_0175122530 /NCGR_PEP_ID=MMETSP0087-20121206/1765_1 /TAXON_ID=136419 /ORGANISM="Unknown Unknown, Strain D1" /LENGTH=1130 /DNA_ID=CAMNT_0016404173 /DNA_START=50 /DNA_END=3442 /DNA_ORIENTATION=+